MEAITLNPARTRGFVKIEPDDTEEETNLVISIRELRETIDIFDKMGYAGISVTRMTPGSFKPEGGKKRISTSVPCIVIRPATDYEVIDQPYALALMTLTDTTGGD